MKRYTHLTEGQRYQISTLLSEHRRASYIATSLGVHRATIGREVIRNSGLRGYRPKQAHEKALSRCKGNQHAKKFDESAWQKVEECLKKKWSPDQVSKSLFATEGLNISHETIYRYVKLDRNNGGVLYRHLRWQKQRRKRFGSRDRRGRIANRVGIEERPTIVEKRSRIGDWEGDLVVGAGHKGAILTLVERKTGFLLARKVESKESGVVQGAIIEALGNYGGAVKTITFDNGKEFAGHEAIASALKCEVYFARPYHSWERGTNENTNGLLRQYFPKKQSFVGVAQEDVDNAAKFLNERPRKRLNYKTPAEAFGLHGFDTS